MCLDHFLVGFLSQLYILYYRGQRLSKGDSADLLLGSLLLLPVHRPPDDGGRVGLLAGADQTDVAAYLGLVRSADVNLVPGN